MNSAKDTVHKHIVYFEGDAEDDQGAVEVAMQWNTSYVESVFSFANNINTHEGGSHLSGLPRGADRHAEHVRARRPACSRRRTEKLEGEDVREGLAAVISVKLREPQFEGQTKTKLGNPWVDGLVAQGRQRRGSPSSSRRTRPTRKQIITKAIAARNARQAARKAREATRKSALENSSLPGEARRLPDQATPSPPSSTSSRATRPAARPSRRATGCSRRSCRCAAR